MRLWITSYGEQVHSKTARKSPQSIWCRDSRTSKRRRRRRTASPIRSWPRFLLAASDWELMCPRAFMQEHHNPKKNRKKKKFFLNQLMNLLCRAALTSNKLCFSPTKLISSWNAKAWMTRSCKTYLRLFWGLYSKKERISNFNQVWTAT